MRTTWWIKKTVEGGIFSETSSFQLIKNMSVYKITLQQGNSTGRRGNNLKRKKSHLSSAWSRKKIRNWMKKTKDRWVSLTLGKKWMSLCRFRRKESSFWLSFKGKTLSKTSKVINLIIILMLKLTRNTISKLRNALRCRNRVKLRNALRCLDLKGNRVSIWILCSQTPTQLLLFSMFLISSQKRTSQLSMSGRGQRPKASPTITRK